MLRPAVLWCEESRKYEYVANVPFCFSDIKISKSEIATKTEVASPTISPVCAAVSAEDVYITYQTPVRGKI
jgi:hypothetical protein